MISFNALSSNLWLCKSLFFSFEKKVSTKQNENGNIAIAIEKIIINLEDRMFNGLLLLTIFLSPFLGLSQDYYELNIKKE